MHSNRITKDWVVSECDGRIVNLMCPFQALSWAAWYFTTSKLCIHVAKARESQVFHWIPRWEFL